MEGILAAMERSIRWTCGEHTRRRLFPLADGAETKTAPPAIGRGRRLVSVRLTRLVLPCTKSPGE